MGKITILSKSSNTTKRTSRNEEWEIGRCVTAAY